MTCFQAEPASDDAAQVVIGSNNEADQETVQSASNSIDNANIAGRRLLSGKQKGYDEAPLLLVCAVCVLASRAEHKRLPALPHSLCPFSLPLCCGASIAWVNLMLCVAGWGDGFQEATLQYLDANNKIVNTQVAVPSKRRSVCSALPLIVSSIDLGHRDTVPLFLLVLVGQLVAHHCSDNLRPPLLMQPKS